MSVQAVALLSKDDVKRVKMTMTITATVEEWRAIQGQLPREWPSWELASVIDKLLDTFFERIDSTQVARA